MRKRKRGASVLVCGFVSLLCVWAGLPPYYGVPNIGLEILFLKFQDYLFVQIDSLEISFSHFQDYCS